MWKYLLYRNSKHIFNIKAFIIPKQNVLQLCFFFFDSIQTVTSDRLYWCLCKVVTPLYIRESQMCFFVYAQKGESVNLVVVVLSQKIYLCVWLVSLLSIFSFIDHDRHLMLILPGLLFLYVVFFIHKKK